jgi:Co/Zn/Cd efflux system component
VSAAIVALVRCPPSYERHLRRALWVALIANASKFFVEAGASWKTESTALPADAIDFVGDAANYGVTLTMLTAGAL